jgi:hypothetical protein
MLGLIGAGEVRHHVIERDAVEIPRCVLEHGDFLLAHPQAIHPGVDVERAAQARLHALCVRAPRICGSEFSTGTS